MRTRVQYVLPIIRIPIIMYSNFHSYQTARRCRRIIDV